MWIPIFLAFLFIFIINISAYFWAYYKQSDHLTDISYSLCFIAVAVGFYIYYGDYSVAKTILTAMVVLWGIRLGSFLFYRINKMGKDDRFDAFRGNWLGFLKFWLLQSMSIWIIALPVMIFLSKMDTGIINYFGISVWLLGFLVESIADFQKFNFKQKNKDAFYSGGLYRYVRYPNYAGEIHVWLGIFIFATSAFDPIDWISIISPIWITILLLFISGIPLLEKKSEKKYGEDPDFQQYKNETAKLIPFIY